MSASTASALLGQLKALIPAGTGAAPPAAQLQQAQDTLRKLKLELVQLPSSSGDKSLLLLQRESLEYACFLSLYSRDVRAFERYLAQVRVLYNDYASALPPSANQGPILGLHLLCLLAQNQIADFHTEYELLCHSASAAAGGASSAAGGFVPPPSPTSRVDASALLSSAYIRFPIQLEAQLMEGCYNQILQGRSQVPLPLYGLFMDTLSETVRNKIADCSEQAYVSLPVGEVQKLLLLPSAEETLKFLATRPKWTNVSGKVFFNRPADVRNVEIPAMKIIQQTLEYATEMERIV